MAAAKSTKKATTSGAKAKATKKTTKKTSTAKKATTAKKPKATKKTTGVKKAAPRKTTKAKRTTSKTAKKTSSNFFSDVIKQATKAQKTAQTQTKALLKNLNALDKQQAQLVTKQSKAKGKSWQSLETKVLKIKTQATALRMEVASSQNSADKLATFIEWTTQLNNKPSTGAYIQSQAQTPSKPSLVKSVSSYTSPSSGGSSAYKSTTASSSSKKDTKSSYGDDFDDEDLDEGLSFGYEDEDELHDEDLGR